MSTIDLFLIGFIVEKPWNAYELAKFVEEWDLQEITRISTPAIYKNLTKLAEKGYLQVQVIKEGERPEKKVYTITDSGQKYFLELLVKNSEAPLYYHFPLNTSIMHLNKLPQKTALQLLDQLKTLIEQKQTFLNRAVKENKNIVPLTGRTLIRQMQLVNRAMLQWIKELCLQYAQE